MSEERFPTLVEVVSHAARLASPVFAAEGWTWASTGATPPTEQQIRERLFPMARECLSAEGDYFIRTGRLSVERVDDCGTELRFGLDLGAYWPAAHPK